MIHQLQAKHFPQVRPLFEALDYHLGPQAVLAGAFPGLVYADDPARPRTALIRIGHRFYMAGDEHNDGFNAALGRLFVEEVYSRALAQGENMFMLYYSPLSWDSVIEAILQDKHPIQDRRQYYRFKAFRDDWRRLIRPGFVVRPVDRDLLEATYRRLENLDWLAEEVVSEEISIEMFLRRRFGFCLIRDNEIAGWCLSEYNVGDRCEVGIATAEAYRRQGVATITGSALVEHALAHGVTRVGWHCWANNEGSIATALRIGFEKERDYPVYFAWFDAVANLAVNGNVCFRRQEYRAAAEWYEAAFAAGEAPAWAYWGAACANALIGRPETAMACLRQAIVRGFDDAVTITASEHLTSLHGTREWRALIEELKGPTAH